MKSNSITFFFLGVFFCLAGCSTSTGFLSHKEIVERITETPKARIERNSLDEEEMRRKANLIPLEDLFGEDLKEIKKKKEKKNIFLEEKSSEKKKRKGADYRYRDTPIKKQWNGTCSTFGGVAGLENLLNKPKSLDLSERDSWSKYKKYSSRSFVNTLSKKGNEICREVDWNQSSVYPDKSCSKNRFWRLGDSVYIEDSIEKALDALDRGSVVYLGMSTPKDMLYCKSVIRTSSAFSKGGHAILIVGYKTDSSIQGGGYFIIKNSWGANCGDYGYQYLPFYLCQRNDGYCIMWEFKTAIDNRGEEPTDPSEPEFKWVKRCERVWYWLWLKKKCRWVKVTVS